MTHERSFASRQQPRPAFPGPYDDPENPIHMGGYKILEYKGFILKEGTCRSQHWYRVQCLECEGEYIRMQSSLYRNQNKGTMGCHRCAKKRYLEELEWRKAAADSELERAKRLWLWVLFTMPATSLRIRDELGLSFDSEKAKVLGCRTV